MTGGTCSERAHRFLESVPGERVDTSFDLPQLRQLVREAVESVHFGRIGKAMLRGGPRR